MAEDQPQAEADATSADATSATVTHAEMADGMETGAPDRVAELERRVAELERQVEQERDQATNYMRRWHTAQADFANFKRRTQSEQEQRDRLLAAQALAPVLNAVDSLERAFMALPPTLRSFSWIEGIALVELQLRRALEMQGIQAIEAEPGQPFDPARHEPIGEVETEQHPAGAIAVVAQRGYEAQGLLIRPALVQLARAPSNLTSSERPKPADSAESAGAASADTASADATEAAPGT